MCEPNNTTLVKVKIVAKLSHNGIEKWKNATIDSCIAPIVKALQEGGIDMYGSCCGHGKTLGYIDLVDGRGLLILSSEQNRKYLLSQVVEEKLEKIYRL